MSKQVKSKPKAKKGGSAASKTAPKRSMAAAKTKTAGRTSGTGSKSAVKKPAQRGTAHSATPAKSTTAAKPVAKTQKQPAKAAKPKAKPAKAAAKTAKAPTGIGIGRKISPGKPSRAKSIADSKKAPAMPKRPVQANPDKAVEKKSGSAAPKASPEKAKSAPPVSRKPDTHVQPPAPAIQTPARPYKAPSEFDGFKVGDHVVYPTHGVGKIVAVEAQEIAGTRLELFVISFEQEKMTLRVPLGKAKAVGMRILSSRDTVRAALKTLQGRARIKRTMWSRRAQEYEAKINSGDLMLIAEVVRDLHRAEGQPEQSYSERQIYESALDRMAREVGAIEELDPGAAMERVEVALKKAA